MASRRNAVIARYKSVLEGIGKPASLTVQRSRYRPVGAGQLPVAQVFVRREDVEDLATSRVTRKVRVGIAVQAKTPAGTPADETLDPILVWVIQAVMGDDSLNGAGASPVAALTVEVSTTWLDGEDTDAEYAAAVIEFDTEYMTLRTDPESLT